MEIKKVWSINCLLCWKTKLRRCPLQDNLVCQHLSKDTSPTIHKEHIKFCETTRISEMELPYENLMDPVPKQQDFMVFLKSTKTNMPIYPIISACGTASYNTAKFISKMLQNYCGKTSSFVKDSADFIQNIKHISINPEEETLVSSDVSALFTSIPVPVALQVINSKISTCTSFTNVYKIPIEKFIKFLEFIITNFIFCFW